MVTKPKLCVICEQPRLPRTDYCPRCKKLIGNKDKWARRLALIAAWNKILGGFVCSYTGVKLEESDTSNPWYLSFDHYIPRKRDTIVVCAAFVNNMKSNLSGDEFWAIVMEFDRHRKGAPFDPDIVKFQYWTRKAFAEPRPKLTGRSMRLVKVDACVICGHPPARYSLYCSRCGRRRPFQEKRLQPMKDAWNKEQDAFLDYYVGVKLDNINLDSPYYMVFDHRIPRKKGDLVVTSMLVNALKTDLSEEEFYLVMNELARHHEGKPFDKAVIRFEYWKRPVYLTKKK